MEELCRTTGGALACAGVQREHGQGAAEEVEHGLSLLREYANMRACYWICPFCPTPEGAPRHFTTAKDFLTHVDACHEGVQMTADGLPCTCVGCNCEARLLHLLCREHGACHPKDAG